MPETRFLATLGPAAARLLRVVHELSFARDLETITSITRYAARDLTGADGVTFVLREPGHSYYADEEAIAPLWKGRRLPLDACIAGWVMTRNERAVIEDIYADSRIPHDLYRPTFVKSLAIVPVRAPQPIAAIGAYWKERHLASDEEIGAMVLLADSAALALTNVQLYHDWTAALEREKQARTAAETAAAAKDEFLALVAHELRQPLHASMAALRLMSARASRESGENARSVVERQVSQMTRLVDDLLDAARIVRGHVSLNLEATNMLALMEHVADSLRPLMIERQHEFVVSLPTHAIELTADAARLQQVFTNLLTNAAKYTDPKGRITLKVEESEGFATITVADTGRGIEASTLPTIFELFTRGIGDVGGFGIGLAVTRRLVELHGGTISASSPGPGQGSEFTVSLPISVSV